MELKVREMTELESKSTQQVEKELLDKHEAQQENKEETNTVEAKQEPEVKEVEQTETTEAKEEPVPEQEVVEETTEAPIEEPQLDDTKVLSYIEQRYGKQIDSFDELLAEREKAEELPEDVAAYFKYKKETGRGISDYVKLQRDYSDMNPDSLLREYYSITEEGLDAEDIQMMMDDFNYDEEVDEPAQIKKLKLAKKKEIAKAKKFFRQQQELYKQPLESRESSGTASEELQAYKQYLNDAKTQQEEAAKRSQWFVQKTNEVFSPEFKGFKFKIDDTEIVYNPGSASELKKAQETPMNFVNKFLDDKGLLIDPVGYHKSLAIAMNPEKFARFFYEQGQSQATDNVMRKTKNIDMTERNAPQTVAKGGLQVKAISQPSSRGLRIKSIKKS
tara:strand:+ start:9553 stop:10719 length:1167 start_codon:yes stop_codon:yes gene_type:complete